jgi:cation transport regulator ChaC
MRLKAIAQVRAQTMAARIRPKVRQPGQPRCSRAATIIAASAKGSARDAQYVQHLEQQLEQQQALEHLEQGERRH